MFFYAVYAFNMETVYAHFEEFSTDEFHAMCEEAPKVFTCGEEYDSPSAIGKHLIGVHGFTVVPYRATFQAYKQREIEEEH